MSKGIVVEHKESGVRYAISEENQDKNTERKVRDLKPGETILGYVPKLGPAAQQEDGDEGDQPTEPTATKTDVAPSGDGKASK